MRSGTEYAKKIVEYLEAIYPERATMSEISKALGIKSCSLNPWMQTLVASKDVEITGKKGRSNLYGLRGGQ